MRRVGLILLAVLVALVVVSRFVPKVEQVSVTGNFHHSASDIALLAGIEPGAPLLWITASSTARLPADPWVLNSVIVREWPNRVSIAVRERSPALVSGHTVWADDGTVLGGATPAEMAGLPRLEGWGEERVAEALVLLRLLRPYGVQVISYSPEGFEVQLDGTQLFTPSAQALREHWSAFVSHRGGRLAVYPWGVSKAHE